MSKSKNYYPVFILLMIGSFIFFLGWSAMQASQSGPQVTDADYYSKGLRYTSTILEKKAAEVLGWSISTKMEGRTLKFFLANKEGQPVKEATGTVSMFKPGTGEPLKLQLRENEPGTYSLRMDNSISGEMTARVEFERNGARLNRQLLINL